MDILNNTIDNFIELYHKVDTPRRKKDVDYEVKEFIKIVCQSEYAIKYYDEYTKRRDKKVGGIK